MTDKEKLMAIENIIKPILLNDYTRFEDDLVVPEDALDELAQRLGYLIVEKPKGHN